MTVHSLAMLEKDRAVLQAVRNGVVGVGIFHGHPRHPGCASCLLTLTSKQVVRFRPGQKDVAQRFEVFPISVEMASAALSPDAQHNIVLSSPVGIWLLETEDWLDPTVRVEGALGESPVMQTQGAPGSRPNTATVTCQYVGGVKLVGANGAELVIATLSFPYTLHVGAFTNESGFNMEAYAQLPFAGA